MFYYNFLLKSIVLYSCSCLHVRSFKTEQYEEIVSGYTVCPQKNKQSQLFFSIKRQLNAVIFGTTIQETTVSLPMIMSSTSPV